MKTIKINQLRYLAMNYADKLVLNEEDEETRKNNDLTETFFKQLEIMIKNKELINITINGQVRNGKSTIGMALGKYINNNILYKLGKTDKLFGMYHVARDQLEGSKKQRDKERNNTVLVIDEWNESGEGGENSTAEKSLANVFSDIHAGRYIHKINISPKYVHDKNSDIILEVVGKDIETKSSRCYLYYKLYQGSRESQELLGYVDIYVGDLIEGWLKIEEKFLIEQKNELSKEIIQLGRKDFYIEYMIKKYEKMDLITKEGIMNPRMLDYAEIIINIIDSLKSLAEAQQPIIAGLIRTSLEHEFRKLKMPLTVFGQALMIERISGALTLYKTKGKLIMSIDKINNSKQLNEHTIKIKKMYIENLEKTCNIINETMNDYKKMIEINKIYHERL